MFHHRRRWPLQVWHSVGIDIKGDGDRRMARTLGRNLRVHFVRLLRLVALEYVDGEGGQGDGARMLRRAFGTLERSRPRPWSVRKPDGLTA